MLLLLLKSKYILSDIWLSSELIGYTDTVGTNQLCPIENDVINSRLSLRKF